MADESEWVDEEPTAQPQNEGQWVDEPQQAQAQPQDEGQWVDEKQGEQPEPAGGLGTTLRRAAHTVIPATVGLGAFAAASPFGGPLVGIGAGIGAASLAGMAQEKLLKMFGHDDEAQQVADQRAHPVAAAIGDVLGGAPTLGVGTEFALGYRALGAGIAGVTDYIMGGDPQHAAVAAAGGALLNKPTKLGESVMGVGETAGKKISSLLARSKADLEGAANISAAPQPATERAAEEASETATGATPNGAATGPEPPTGNPARNDVVGAKALQDSVETPRSQGPGPTVAGGVAEEKALPINNGNPSGEPQSQVTRDHGNDGRFEKAATNEVSPPIQKEGKVPAEFQAALKTTIESPTITPEPPTNAPRFAGPTPPPADGDVRFYHGGDNPTTGGSRWVTPDPTYARDFRSDGTPKNVHYVDIPKGDPAEVGLRSWDEQLDAGTNAVGHYHHGEIPEALAQKLQPYRAEPPEIAMLKQQAAQREAAANRTNNDVLKGPVLNEEGGTPSPELNEATRQAVETARGGKPPPPPEKPPKGGPAEPIPPERYTGGKFDTPLNAANTVNNALDNVVRNQAALWHGFRNLLKDITNKDSSLMGKGGGDISRAIERGEFDKLDPKVQEAYNKHIGPINEESAEVAAELNKRGIKPPDEDMASNYIMHNRKMPFSLKEALNNDPTGMLQGMRKPDTFKGLEYRGAVADNGSRLSIRDLGDKYSVGKNGEESFYNKPNSKDGAKMFKNGDEIEYNGKTYKIDRGIQDEITRDFRDEKGRPIEYHQNAILSALERNSQLKAALQYDDMMRTFKTDKALDPYRTTMNDPKAAQLAKAGWEKVDSPGFENILMHPDMAQAIKNNFEPGLFKANPITNFARAMNQFAVRSIFWNPVPHSLNAAVHYIVARGEDWLPVKFEPGTYKVGAVTLDNYRSLMGSLSKAWDTVVNQTPDLVKLNNSGLPMVWSSIERQRAHELTGKLLDTSLKSEPKFWAGMASKYGLGAPVDAVRAVYNSSAKVLWMASDVMTAARYHELMGKGLSSDEAISHMSIHMPDYRPALSLLGVRGLPSAMGDSTLFMFGRYHAGVLRSLENMVTGALGKNSTVDERREAFGNIGALFVMGAIVYPLLDKATQVITGNKDAEVRRSGPLSPITNTLSAIKGEGTFGRTLGNLNTLSPLANAAVETLRNKDFSNSDIVAPMSPFYKKVDQYADYLARNMVAPYGTAQKMANPKGPGVASTLVHELTGVKVPTPDEIKSKTKRLDRAQSDAAYRDKHPRGMLESLVNKVTPQSPRVRQKDAQP